MKFNDIFNRKEEKGINEAIKTAQLIMPIEIISNLDLADIEEGDLIEFENGLRFEPVKVVNKDGEVFLALYSNDEQIPEPTSTIDVYAEKIAEMIGSNPENISGVVINPFSNYNVELEMDSFLNLFKD